MSGEHPNLWKGRKRQLNNRARMHGCADHLSIADLHWIVERDGSTCVFCDLVLDYDVVGDNTSESATFEHVVRLCDGGANTVANVVCCCRGCNSKNNRRSLTDPMGAALERLQRHLSSKERAA